MTSGTPHTSSWSTTGTWSGSFGPTFCDRTVRGNWTRLAVDDGGRWRLFYYWRRVRVPWIAWAMFS